MSLTIGRTLLFAFIALFSSCSLVQKVAIRQTGEIIYNSSFDQQSENDWEMFSSTLSGNIKMVESFLSQDPENQDLIVTLIKAYAAKGYGVDETLFLEDKYQDKNNSVHRKRALVAYTRVLQLGTRFFKSNGIPTSLLTDNLRTPEKLREVFNEKLSSTIRDIEAIAYIGQALGGLINLQKNNMRIIGYVPVMKELFDWSCRKDAKLAFGLCDIFYASYDSSRPRMLGGNPSEGKRKFLKAMKMWPNSLLVRVAYIENYVIAMLDESQYREQKIELMNRIERLEKSKIWKGEKIDLQKKDYTNIYNVIAAKRFNIIKKFEKEIF